jgi:hypothetical protein
MNAEQAIDRLREVIKPGKLSCLWCTAAIRLTLVSIATTPLICRDIMLEESAIAAEVRAMQADHPGAKLCADHQAKMAELDAVAVGVVTL